MGQLSSIDEAIKHIHQHEVIAYPTESIFGLGCDPDDEQAVMKLLKLKQRPIEKGLILIADSYEQLRPYIDDSTLTEQQKQTIFASWPGPVTWVFPKRATTPFFLTGQFDSIAVRVTNHPLVKALCQKLGKPFVSTSANLSTYEPCKSEQEVYQQFGQDFPVLSGKLGGREKPSEIRDAKTGQIIRLG
ncbi:L-threonylcarbamoyladenylate synthase type 1 TsaC [Zophobihabitans entericus]|uniref:Threonylcarbamoyl-AMP synthase n=1 Tax=Zophobihabitans entericus TaxID=1635327 RepID=A0A6G9I9H3_9GAMM|nr:L-threonylcarbamoyladenylate synthase type 1 TsaC [Zophobihabitans entericus]QIQ20479.1 L-threonylcarbamoyladenylate synthase type 1 TsaC [Zophobihabitans entericus]